MKTEIFFNGNVIAVKSVFKGKKPWKADKNNTNYHIVEVSFKGNSVGFDYWAPLTFPKIYNDTGNIEALCCFLRDAEAGDMPFQAFCNSFGYDVDDLEGTLVWHACRGSLQKANEIFPDYYTILKYLSNKYKL